MHPCAPAHLPLQASTGAFAFESSFEEAPGEAEYPPAAWTMQRSLTSESALLYSLNEVVDETYTVYWDLTL